jgi:hypothetical protein
MESPIDDLNIAEVRLVAGSSLRDKLKCPYAVEFTSRIRAWHSSNRRSDTHAGQEKARGRWFFMEHLVFSFSRFRPTATLYEGEGKLRKLTSERPSQSGGS